MTKEELKKAFLGKYIVHRNYRDFERGLSDMRVRLIDGRFYTYSYIHESQQREKKELLLDELLEKINSENWVLEDLEEDQKIELDILSKLSNNKSYYKEKIETFLHTAKSGRKIQVFFVKHKKGCLKKKDMDYLFSWMNSLSGCWWNKEKGGFIMPNREIAEEVIDFYDHAEKGFNFFEYMDIKRDVIEKMEQRSA